MRLVLPLIGACAAEQAVAQVGKVAAEAEAAAAAADDIPAAVPGCAGWGRGFGGAAGVAAAAEAGLSRSPRETPLGC